VVHPQEIAAQDFLLEAGTFAECAPTGCAKQKSITYRFVRSGRSYLPRDGVKIGLFCATDVLVTGTREQRLDSSEKNSTAEQIVSCFTRQSAAARTDADAQFATEIERSFHDGVTPNFIGPVD
jgi:hypothetical protein